MQWQFSNMPDALWKLCLWNQFKSINEFFSYHETTLNLLVFVLAINHDKSIYLLLRIVFLSYFEKNSS